MKKWNPPSLYFFFFLKRMVKMVEAIFFNFIAPDLVPVTGARPIKKCAPYSSGFLVTP